VTRRCHVTKNQCGTDTVMVGHVCPCVECQAYHAEMSADPTDRFACEHGHSRFLSSPCPHCPAIPISIRPLPCKACYDCLHDPSLGFKNPTVSRMILCPLCGNKRCPKATNHRHPCGNSNIPGQKGSNYK
jgi:hypothetical protein